ncbi:uncharacterized protein LOC113361611 isoform X2 [Papaver somniferum]|uniref:uncharacterized protein LOC113361611 isoform X2 n=1 Tax=Papaver somniferum TaxID=3469 RepID=UPI000E6F9658|nr:uncharacterized protein LOC113361611 isoform X2 [Papaver somniferum]
MLFFRSVFLNSWKSYIITEEPSCFEHNSYIVTTCDSNLKRKIHKVLKNNSNGAETGSLLHLMKEETPNAQLRVLEYLWIHTFDRVGTIWPEGAESLASIP